jgi:hypothetical protein
MQACRIMPCYRKKGATGHAAAIRNDSNLQFETVLKAARKCSRLRYEMAAQAERFRHHQDTATIATLSFKIARVTFAGARSRL